MMKLILNGTVGYFIGFLIVYLVILDYYEKRSNKKDSK